MILSAKKMIRRFAWKILGPLPQKYSHKVKVDGIGGIDTRQPRFQMLDNAIVIVQHNTRISHRENQVGEKGSLLGDYLEFGCFEGSTFLHSYKRAAPLMPWMRFLAFDSFQGLPEPTGPDRDGEFWAGQFACSQEGFLSNLEKNGVDPSRVICVPGWFNESLTPKLKQENHLSIASIVYVDLSLIHI